MLPQRRGLQRCKNLKSLKIQLLAINQPPTIFSGDAPSTRWQDNICGLLTLHCLRNYGCTQELEKILTFNTRTKFIVEQHKPRRRANTWISSSLVTGVETNKQTKRLFFWSCTSKSPPPHVCLVILWVTVLPSVYCHFVLGMVFSNNTATNLFSHKK